MVGVCPYLILYALLIYRVQGKYYLLLSLKGQANFLDLKLLLKLMRNTSNVLLIFLKKKCLINSI